MKQRFSAMYCMWPCHFFFCLYCVIALICPSTNLLSQSGLMESPYGKTCENLHLPHPIVEYYLKNPIHTWPTCWLNMQPSTLTVTQPPNARVSQSAHACNRAFPSLSEIRILTLTRILTACKPGHVAAIEINLYCWTNNFNYSQLLHNIFNTIFQPFIISPDIVSRLQKTTFVGASHNLMQCGVK